MATLLDFVTNPDIIAYALLFITVMADCSRRPLAASFEIANCDFKRPWRPRRMRAEWIRLIQWITIRDADHGR